MPPIAQEHLSIGTFNIEGLVKRKEMNCWQVENYKMYVYCLQEIKIKERQDKLITLETDS